MSEPRRWKDSPDAPVGMRELLHSSRASRPLDEAAFRRGAARVATFSVAPAAVAAVSVWAKLAAAGVVGLAAAGAVVAADALRSPSHDERVVSPVAAATAVTPSPRTAVPLVPAALPPVEEPPSPPAIAPPVTAIRARTQPASVMAVATASASPAEEAAPQAPEEPHERARSTLDDELQLLESARDLLARSPETALAKLAEHRARFPSGVLTSERDLMELDGLRRTGRVAEARSRAQAWLAREPSGMHAERVRRILSSLD
jgi:hypothetical protein